MFGTKFNSMLAAALCGLGAHSSRAADPAFIPAPASPSVSFSAAPDSAEIAAARVFEETLVWIPSGNPPEKAENKALAGALSGYEKERLAAGPSAGAGDLTPFEQFIVAYPRSGWRVSLWTDLGLEYYRRGAFSKALAAWSQAWETGQRETEPRAAAIVNRAVTELARMKARLGDADGVEALVAATAGRPMEGLAAATLANTKDCLWTMRHNPGESYKCGPWALDSILTAADPAQPYRLKIKQVVSPESGITLDKLAGLASEMHMDLKPAHRTGAAAIPAPSVVHWKLNHYGALLRKEGNSYLLQDPTFGGNPRWVSASVIDEESSGYFLVPAATLAAAGWRTVPDAEARGVFGKGSPLSINPNCGGPADPQAPGGGAPGNTKPGKKDPPKPCMPPTGPPNGGGIGGMASYSIFLLTAGLDLRDDPIGYTPPAGPLVHINLNYGMLENNQPSTLTYSNLGTRWNLDWITTLTFDTNNAYVSCGQGGTEVFPNFTSTSTVSQPTMAARTVIVNAGHNVYQEVFPDGSMKVFGLEDGSQRYYMTSFVDEQGLAVKLAYDNQYRLMTITDAVGQVTTFTYGNTSDPLKITKITDPFSRTTSFQYDANNHLIQITDAAGLNSQFGYVSGSDAVQSLTTGYGTTTFAYTVSGLDHNLVVTLPDGSQERVQTLGGPTAAIPDSETVTPAGMSVLNVYLTYRNSFYWDRKAMLEAPGDVTKAHLTHFCHGANLSEDLIVDSEKAPLENRVWYRYQNQAQPNFTNAGMLGNLTQVGRVLDDGSTQLFQLAYNANGNPTQKVDPAGRTTNFVYASNGIDLLETHQVLGTGGGDALISRTTYNAQHRPIAITGADGQTATFTYNAAGQPLTATDQLSNTTTFTYNAASQLTSISGPLAGATAKVTMTYDPVGRIASMTDALGHTLTYSYDALNRTTKIGYPDGTSETYAYTLLDATQFTDRLQRVTAYTFNSLDQLVKTVDPLGHAFTLSYCRCGELASLSDGLGRATSYTYDVQGRKTARIFPDGSKVTYQYEQTTSRRKSQTDALGQTKSYVYNIDDTLAAVVYSNTALPIANIAYKYDPDYPRIASYSDATGATSFTYNQASTPPALGALKMASAKGPSGEIDLTYDALSRVATRTINGATETIGYDSLGRITGDTNALGAFVYAYLTNSRLVSSVQMPNGITSNYTYFNATGDNRLQKIQHILSGGATLDELDYTDNAVGQIATWSQSRNGAAPSVWTPGYDKDDQLVSTSVTNPAASYAYAYDAAANRTAGTVNGTATTATYDALNQILSVTPPPESDRTYQWDAEERLVGITYPSTGKQTQISYDGFGRRTQIVEKTGSTVNSVTNFLWDGLLLCAETNASGAITKRFFQQGEQNLAGASPVSLYYTRDHLGSVREMTDSTGAVRAAYNYDPYGRATKVSGDLDSDFGFAGYFNHAASGLSLAPMRAYDPNLGRWLSRDPMEERGPDGPNLYHYAVNDPVNATDPLGLACLEYTVFTAGDLETLYANLAKKYGVNVGLILDILNLEPLHEEFFFDDGSTAGFAGDGVTPLASGAEKYIKRDCSFDDCILKKAVALNPWPGWSYTLIGINCQSWAATVETTYNILAAMPSVQQECHPSCSKK
jgi:RHS repeat-associated protein